MLIKLYFQTDAGMGDKPSPDLIISTLNRVAKESNVSDLVVALYILPDPAKVRGAAYVRRWMTPEQYSTSRGHWALTQQWETPQDLPHRYRLIRMRLDGDLRSYPRTETDGYRWRLSYGSFMDHLAMLFAHELHHFRRYHLNLHHREGEHGANRWALAHVRQLGFDVKGSRLPVRKRRKTTRFHSFKRSDPYAAYRNVKCGDQVIIRQDPKHRYVDEAATVIRSIRSNSKRMVIQTSDGKEWRWPIAWLARIEKDG